MNLFSQIFKVCLLFVIMAMSSILASAQEITGVWFNQEKDAKIEIYKENNKYFGKIVWLKEPNRDGKPKLDAKNVKVELRSKPLMGLLLLKDFVKKSDKEYEDGTIYDPKSGKTYSCIITVKDVNTLSIRGYVGISFFGRTTTWTKTTLD
jgi:uncharacterized protein (DUF2147 family)